MAMTVHLFLKANGTDIQGDSTVTSLERENSIECLSFESGMAIRREERGKGMLSGEREYIPIKIVKRFDKASPLLAKALCQNEVIEGTFKFYRPNPAGDGTTEQFFTVEIKEGRVSSIREISPDVIDPATANSPPTEEVSFIFGYIRWTYEPAGVEHVDHWSERA